ncbi:hypothetical protein B0T25DRAFT_341036 [Lasiosphaeria hispida]|uniref:Septum formation initiator domain-containing protein n=1 Tax=Lasiosphaeria hispida TaxID=260671 RepID=A0AAJ0H6E0_9PEZI|nr:hypothetical protein B0T25DRAFT_341036 [Lasiosphaeria hispida]
MAHNGVEGPKETPPHRTRHQITRSISELSSPIRLHRHHSHRAVKERERDGLSPAPQAAIPMTQTRMSLDGSRSDGVTPNLSPNASRRTSILIAPTDEPSATVSSTTTPAPPNLLTSKVPTEDDIARERQKAAVRESGLKKSLTELEAFSTATTRHLDDTYYSVLEKLGTLQSTIVALKELAGLSQQMNNTFGSEAEELVTEVNSQLDAFGQFEEQQKRVERLQSRIHIGREKITVLSGRVDVVRDRIESWERADREWQERTRKRLKAFWVVTSIVTFIMLLLLVSAQYAPESLEGSTVHLANESLNTLRNVTGVGANLLWPDTDAEDGRVEETLNGTETAEAPSISTDILRAFDEL